MSDNPLSGKVGLDTTDFKAGIAELNRSIRVIESGFRATAAGLGDWSKSASGLEARIKALNSEIDVQKTKVGALAAEHAKVVASQGANSKAAQDLEIRLNKETETLGKMENELSTTVTALNEYTPATGAAGKETDKLGTQQDETTTSGGKLNTMLQRLKASAGEMGKEFKGLGDNVLKGVGIGLAGLAAGAVAGIGALGLFAVKAAKSADELVEMSDKTGISVEKLQELAFIGKQTGTEVDTVTGSYSKMIKAMGAATKGSSEQGKAFRELGVNVFDANGNFRDANDVFDESIAALGKIPNETERDIAAFAIFGKSALELNPLIKLSEKGLKDMTAQAHDLGAVISEEDIQASAEFNDQLDALKAGFTGIVGRLAGAFLPILKTVAGVFMTWLSSPAVRKGLDIIATGIKAMVDALLSGDIRGIFTAIGVAIYNLTGNAKVADFFVNLGRTIEDFAQKVGAFVTGTLIPFVKEHWPELRAALIAIGAVLAAAGIVAAVAGIAGAIAALVNPIGLIVAAIALLAAAWEGNWGGMRDKLMEAWAVIQPVVQEIWNWLSVNVPAGLEVLRAFWVDVAWPAISNALQATWNFLQPILQTIWDWLKVNIPAGLQFLHDAWVKVVWPAIQNAIRIAWPIIQTVFNAIRDFIVNTLVPTLTALYNKWVTEVWPTIQTVTQNVWTIISAVFAEIGRWINDNIVPWIQYLHDVWVNDVWPPIQYALESAWKIIEPIWKSLKEWLDTKLPPALTGLQSTFETIMTAIQKAIAPVKKIWDDFVTAVQKFWEWITGKDFSIKVSMPNLPSPPKPPTGGGGGGGNTSNVVTNNTYNLSAGGGSESNQDLIRQLRMEELLNQ